MSTEEQGFHKKERKSKRSPADEILQEENDSVKIIPHPESESTTVPAPTTVISKPSSTSTLDSRLFSAIKNGKYTDAVQILNSEQPIRVNSKDSEGMTAMILLIKRARTVTSSEEKRNFMVLIGKLINRKEFDPNAYDNEGFTAGMIAVTERNRDIFKLLLKHPKLDVNHSPPDMCSILWMVLETGEEDMLMDIIESKKKLDMSVVNGINIDESSSQSCKEILNSKHATASDLGSTGEVAKFQRMKNAIENYLYPPVTLVRTESPVPYFPERRNYQEVEDEILTENDLAFRLVVPSDNRMVHLSEEELQELHYEEKNRLMKDFLGKRITKQQMDATLSRSPFGIKVNPQYDYNINKIKSRLHGIRQQQTFSPYGR